MLKKIATFTVEGAPVGKGRPKFARRGNFVTAYTPAKTKTYEAVIADFATTDMGAKPCSTGAVQLHVDAYMPIPASWSRAKKLRALRGEIHPTTKPDLDNVCKAGADALNGIAYKDDSQIVGLSMIKR